MVRSIFFLALFVLLACQSDHSQKEEQAIKAAIQEELDGYITRDHAKWSSHWVHEPYTKLIVVQNGYYQQYTSWDSLNAMFKDIFSDTSAYTTKHQKTVLSIQNYGNAAFVTAEEIIHDPGSSIPPDSSDLLIILEKKDGLWLIVNQTIFYKSTFSNTDQAVESKLNIAGYELLWRNKIKESIEVFKLNAQLFPKSVNVYDSLGEAYMKAEQKGPAIQNYEKSLKLNPKNANAIEMLKKLKK